jgi:hypothetical protein
VDKNEIMAGLTKSAEKQREVNKAAAAMRQRGFAEVDASRIPITTSGPPPASQPVQPKG